MPPKPVLTCIAYYRVSTDKQGRSGLGLEAQVTAVQSYAHSLGSRIIREFTEVESGKRADRPQLASALAHAKRTGSTLVIAKLDRLARNVHFLSGLMEAGVDFVCCDMPSANRLTLHIMAAVAEDEAKRISERTKAALAAYKARGGVLGAARPECRRLTPELAARGRLASAAARRRRAKAAYSDLSGELRALRAGGESLRGIARRLNEAGHTTVRGRAWTAVQVKSVLDRHGSK